MNDYCRKRKDETPPPDSVTPDDNRTVNLTGLTPGTTYTYAAYGDSGCTNLMATAEAFTTGSTVTISLDAPQGAPIGLTAKVYTGVVSDGKNLPNAVVKSLGQQTPTSNDEVTWSCSDSGAGCDLSANTIYHLVLEGAAPASGNHHYTWGTA